MPPRVSLTVGNNRDVMSGESLTCRTTETSEGRGLAAQATVQVIETATTLAHHRTKIAGGVQVTVGPSAVDAQVPRSSAVAALSMMLSAVASRPEVRAASRGVFRLPHE
jgi:hypothetical protein